MNRSYSKFLTFIFSCIPGAGAMYLGLMKRGVSIMLTFAAIIGIATLPFLAPVSVLCGIVWFYGFFDTHHTLRKLMNGEDVKDEPIINLSALSFNGIQFSNKFFGYVLLAIGGLIVFGQIFDISRIIFEIDYYKLKQIKELLLGGALIVSGFYLLKRTAKPKYPLIEELSEDDI